MADETRAEDPRILSREDWEMLAGGIARRFPETLVRLRWCYTAQRERIATLEADNRRLFEHIIAISTTAGNRSLSEMELRAKIIGVCHSALQPSRVQSGATDSARTWPKCRCGGVVVTNASDDITRTCIRCGAIVKPAPQLSGEAGEVLFCSRCGSALSVEPGSDTGFRCDACGWADALAAEPTTEKQG